MRHYNIAVVGATGMVGEKMLEVLSERNFPIDKLYLFSSSKSAGKVIEYRGVPYTVEELTPSSFNQKAIDIALFSAGGTVSKTYAPIAKKHKIVVIDNSSTWRMNKDVPLVVPEINPEAAFEHDYIIANPNCSTIQSVLPLKPLLDTYGIKRIVYSTYQAVSGAGVKGVRDLEESLTENFPYQISENVLPHIDVFLDNGYSKEEDKMINETRKILSNDQLRITATTVRVPIRNTHAIAINVELEKDFKIEAIKPLLSEFPGIIIEDDLSNLVYPLAQRADGTDEVYVGRIRRDFSVESGLNLWCVADNIRKGAATNAVQIAELLVHRWDAENPAA